MVFNKPQVIIIWVQNFQLQTSNSTAEVTLTWSHQLPGTLCAEFFIEMKNPLAKILRPSKSVLVIKVAMAGRVQPSKHNRVQKTLEFQAETRLKSAMIEKSSQASDNLQYNMLGRWDKWLIKPSKWFFKYYFSSINSFRLRALKTLCFYFSKTIRKQIETIFAKTFERNYEKNITHILEL